MADYQPGPNLVTMVIKKWCFIGTFECPPGDPSYPGPWVWLYKLILNLGDYMVPPPAGYGDLTNLEGLRGQGEPGFPSLSPNTPLEKVFDRHFIVQVPTLDGVAPVGNQYYDPSYGVTYPSEAGFESQAVAGYAWEFPFD